MYKPSAIMWQPLIPSFLKITVLGSALATLGLTGCASSQTTTPKNNSNTTSGQYLGANNLDGLEDLLSATDMRAVEGDRLLVLKHGDVWKRMSVGFKMNSNQWDPRIEAQRGWFISRQPYLDRLSARASRYLYHTVKEAERRGLPTELALLPIIESSYDPAATSSAAAAGLWQFIPSTGRIYGLQQTPLYDGRRDVVESTRAAYEFLSSLYNQFGSWELALAAYNAGPGRIQQAINRNRAAGLPTDYWSLKLPQETMNYVPRFLAVAQIIKNPSQYNVSLPPIANRPHFREVTVGPADLNEIAVITGLTRAELYALNPGHRGDRIDSQSPMKILIPADISPSVDAKLKNLKTASGAVWAGAMPKTTSTPTPAYQPVTPAVTPRPTTTPTAPVTPTVKTPTAPVVSSTPAVTASTVKTTPQGANALASFASNSDIPSAPRIPIAVTPSATTAKTIATEPPVSDVERQKILAALKEDGVSKSVEEVLQPVASKAEQDAVIQELTALAPKGTEIVDPYDGKIKLTAIQTSQSIAEQQGKEVTLGYAYPKAVADKTSDTSDEAQRNQGKNVIHTDADVVVVAPKGKRSTYTVLAGDTLALIAMKNGVNWRDVAKWNQMEPNATLYAGTTIYLYDAKPIATAAKEQELKAKEKPETYVVKANDSLSSIASQYGLTLKQLAEWNDLTPQSGIMVGQKLSLKAPESKAKATSSETSMKTTSYTVKRGEYLGLIADRYALSNQALAELTTGLTASSQLYAGQRINVPVDTKDKEKDLAKASATTEPSRKNSVKTENYIVQRGDTYSSIAEQSKISIAELLELNQLKSSSSLMAGQSIKIPEGSAVPQQYTVQAGDTLSAVSTKFGIALDQLATLNGLSRTSGLRVGQVLKLKGNAAATASVPTESANVSSTSNGTYTVKSGDTLASVARAHKLELAELAALNDLTTQSHLRVGQRLNVEATTKRPTDSKPTEAKAKSTPSSKATEKYTVKSGESLNSIANRVGISTKELADMNNLSASAGLRVGQSLTIPKVVVDYKVRSGDTLIRIANRYGIAAQDLADMNNLKSNAQLKIGDVIQVPN